MQIKPESLYPSDLTDAQWHSIRRLLPKAKPRGRPRKINLRRVIDAVFFVNRSGVAWRYLPKEFPPWQSVYRYFRRWLANGVWRCLHDTIVRRVRKKAGKKVCPTCAIVDSQSIKAAEGEERGFDGFKKIRGRKRQILVDTLGLLHAVSVHRANLQDCMAGKLLYSHCSSRLVKAVEKILADLGYRGTFVVETEQIFGFAPTIHNTKVSVKSGGPHKSIKEKRAHKKLHGLTEKRWIVERTFAWLGRFRRLSCDYEKNVSTSETMIYIAMTQIGLHRL